MALYDADIIRAIRDGEEDLDTVRMRLDWKAREAWQQQEKLTQMQIRQAKLIAMALQEPEDTEAHQMAEAWLRAEEAKLEDDNEVAKEHRRKRAILERLYIDYLKSIPYIKTIFEAKEEGSAGA